MKALLLRATQKYQNINKNLSIVLFLAPRYLQLRMNVKNENPFLVSVPVLIKMEIQMLGLTVFPSIFLNDCRTPISPQHRICFSWPAGNQLFQSLDRFCPVIINSPVKQNRQDLKRKDVMLNKINTFHSAHNFLLYPHFAWHKSVCLTSSIWLITSVGTGSLSWTGGYLLSFAVL